MQSRDISRGWVPAQWGDPNSRVEMYTNNESLIEDFRPNKYDPSDIGKRKTSDGVVMKKGVECYVLYCPAADIEHNKSLGFVTDPLELVSSSDGEVVKRGRGRPRAV